MTDTVGHLCWWCWVKPVSPCAALVTGLLWLLPARQWCGAIQSPPFCSPVWAVWLHFFPLRNHGSWNTGGGEAKGGALSSCQIQHLGVGNQELLWEAWAMAWVPAALNQSRAPLASDSPWSPPVPCHPKEGPAFAYAVSLMCVFTGVYFAIWNPSFLEHCLEEVT